MFADDCLLYKLYRKIRGGNDWHQNTASWSWQSPKMETRLVNGVHISIQMWSHNMHKENKAGKEIINFTTRCPISKVPGSAPQRQTVMEWPRRRHNKESLADLGLCQEELFQLVQATSVISVTRRWCNHSSSMLRLYGTTVWNEISTRSGQFSGVQHASLFVTTGVHLVSLPWCRSWVLMLYRIRHDLVAN